VPESTGSALVSVVIPCFDVGQYIGDCLDSVFLQSYPEIEIICVDDGSSDDTCKILETFGERIKLIKSDHRGAPRARNLGLAEAKGEYIQFLDADDLLLRDKISHQVALFESNPGACLIAARYGRLGLDGKLSNVEIGTADPWSSLIISRLGITSANFWKKSIVDRVNGWDERLSSSQEANLIFRILQRNTQVIFDSQNLTTVRDRESGSIRESDPIGNSIRFMDLRLDILNYLDEFDQLSHVRKDWISVSILNMNRNLKKFDNELAMTYFKKHLAGRLNLASNRFFHPLYRLLMIMIGFQATEKIREVTRKILQLEGL
jgi:glycosyltransferase involved in cell wall biosynthesis